MRLWPFYSDAAAEQVTALIRAGSLAAMVKTPEIASCEAQLTEALAPTHEALLCTSGTAGLATAYAALGLERGSEVLVPAHTFRATVTPLLMLGLRPVLCDCDPKTGNIDLADAERRITARTQALAVTHVWGRPVPLDTARELADRRGLALVEDCSHAHGVHWRGRPVGTVGDVAVFSLGTTKMVSGGMAGAVLTGDRGTFERAVAFGQPKHRGLADVQQPALRALLETGVGNNFRVSPIAAVLVADHLTRLPATLALRERNLAAVTEHARLLPGLEPVATGPDRTAGTLYKLHFRWRGRASADDVVALLRGLGVRVRRPQAGLHRTPLFQRPELLAAFPSVPSFDACDPAAFPQTDRFLTDLVEFDGLDLYEDDPQAVARYARAFQTAADRLDADTQGAPC